MIRIDTIPATTQIAALRSQLSGGAINKAMSRSINRTLTHEKTVSKRAARAKYNFPAEVLDNFKTFTANPNRLEGKLAASGSPIPINRLNPRFTPGPGGNGVTFSIIKGRTERLAFAFRVKTDGPVFARGGYVRGAGFKTGKSRLPIAKMVTLSLYQAIAGQIPRVALNRDSLQFYNQTFLRELNYQVRLATTPR